MRLLAPNLFDRDTAVLFADRLVRLVAIWWRSDDAGWPVGDSWPSGSARSVTTVGGRTASTARRPLAALFEAQVAAKPVGAPVEADGTTLRYTELNEAPTGWPGSWWLGEWGRNTRWRWRCPGRST